MMARMNSTTEADMPPKLDGTTIARSVLSALAETRSVPEGLKRSAVGGKLWVSRILRSGCGSAARERERHARQGCGHQAG